VPARHGAQNTSTNRNGKAIRRATGSGAKPFCGITVAEAELRRQSAEPVLTTTWLSVAIARSGTRHSYTTVAT
jgi:hypothetical protein